MKIVLGSAVPKMPTDLLVVLVREEEVAKDAFVQSVDKALGGALLAVVTQEEWSGKKDSLLWIPTAGKLPARKVALIGLGKAKTGSVEIRSATARGSSLGRTQKRQRSWLLFFPMKLQRVFEPPPKDSISARIASLST